MYLFSLCDLFKLNELLKINQLEYYSMLYIKFDQHQRKPCLHCQGGHYGICHQVYLHFYKVTLFFVYYCSKGSINVFIQQLHDVMRLMQF